MKYSKVKTREICKYSRQGNNNKDAATLADIDEDTFYEWMKKSEFSESIKKAQVEGKDRNIQIIQKAGKKFWTASAWWVERKQPDEFAVKQKIDQTTPQRFDLEDLKALLSPLPVEGFPIGMEQLWSRRDFSLSHKQLGDVSSHGRLVHHFMKCCRDSLKTKKCLLCPSQKNRVLSTCYE